MDIDKLTQIAHDAMVHRKTSEARETGYIFYHGKRTAEIALKLADQLQAEVNRELLYIGALFHDIGKGNEPHNESGALIVRELLSELYPTEALDNICEIVLCHNRRLRFNEFSLAIKIVQDADILDRVGPMAVWHIFYKGFASDCNVDDTLIFGNGEERTKHLSLLKSVLNFSISQKLFDRRAEFEHQIFKVISRCQQGELYCDYENNP